MVDLQASLHHIETLENELQTARHEHDSIERTRAALETDLHAAELDLQAARGELDSRARVQAGLERELQTVRGELDVIRSGFDTTSAELASSRRQIDDLLTSKSWRWMAPLRAVNRLLTGDPR
jgi:chromosome segregation ATPase